MVKLIELEDNDSQKALESGEFSQKLINSSPRVIIILTQSWCPDWWAQKLVFKDKEIEEREDLKVYFLEYDRKAYRSEFTAFKERVFGNGQIPYLRFYRNGKFEISSNYSGRRAIRKWLNT